MTGSDTDEPGIEREDIRLTTHDGHPALEIGDATLMLRTQFEGAPAQNVELDHLDDWPFFVLDFDEEYFGGFLEITPEYIPAEDPSSEVL